MKKLLDGIDSDGIEEIHLRLLSGAVSRSAFLCYLWAVIATLFGFASVNLFKTHIPDITLFENVWPRFVFNSIPAFMLGLWYSRHKVNTRLKAYSTVIVLPLLLVSASVIHAWPIFWTTDPSFYLYFHATNIIAVSTAIAVGSGSPALMFSQAFGFLLVFFGPLVVLFLKHDKMLLLNTIASDFGFLLSILIPSLYAVYTLRFKLAATDYKIRKSATSFLGKQLTESIYQSADFAEYTQEGAILSFDIRGYTSMVHACERNKVRAFMQDYHRSISKSVGELGGYVHKSSGDGHIISFGIMDREEDLSDLPGIDKEILEANYRKKAEAFKKCLFTFERIVREFENIKLKHSLPVQLLIGSGLAYGNIDVIVRGDKNFRQELDIDGETIVRAVRLEGYSKLLNTKIDPNSSFLVISPEYEDICSQIKGIKSIRTDFANESIRDYPWIKSVFFRQWKNERIRTAKPA